MTTIKSFTNRLKKLGIDVKFSSNYPWLYLYSVNGKIVEETLHSDHGFTVFFRQTTNTNKDTIPDIKATFQIIRKYL